MLVNNIIYKLKLKINNLLKVSLILLCVFVSPARAGEDVLEWMDKTLDQIANIFNTCITVPENISYLTGTKALDVSKSGEWFSTGEVVASRKLLRFDWRTSGVTARPKKYLVLYRIDPRFERPQVFIQTFNYNTNKYTSDFHNYNKLLDYQKNPAKAFNDRLTDYTNYFNFNGRDKIQVNKDDVINITLIDSKEFFVGNSEFKYELENGMDNLTTIYTKSATGDNKIIYAAPTPWCDAVSPPPKDGSSDTIATCATNSYLGKGADKNNILTGMPNPIFTSALNALVACESGAGKNSPLCYNDKGRGMAISIDGTQIKKSDDSFIFSDFNNKTFFYHHAKNAGGIDFTTDWQIKNMFASSYPQTMLDWKTYNNEGEILQAISNSSFNIAANIVHFGRYIMELQIGNGLNALSTADQSAMKIEYFISMTPPPAGTIGTIVTNNFRTDANANGYLWLKLTNPNSHLQGSINVNYAHYIGNTFFSEIIYEKLIKPIQTEFRSLSTKIYHKLITNRSFQGIARAMLILYIATYALWFLAGVTQVTVNDMLVIIIKVVLVTVLFSPESWKFFNTYFFKFFTEGMDYLFRHVSDSSSSSHNLFGFIDPIFDKYSNPKIWLLLFIQLLQFQNGLTFFAIITIYSLLTFFRSVIEVVICYILAFVGLAVMISFAPLFIVLILFERTRSIFDNWVSVLFDYMIKPTILLIFFLLIDQIIELQLTHVITKACWGCWIDIYIHLDLTDLGIPVDWSFQLPFFPCIPFFVTHVTELRDINDVYMLKGTFLHLAVASLMFYSFCKVSEGLVEYVTLVTSMLTNVQAARQYGERKKSENPINSVVNDIKSVTTDPVKSAYGVFKDKVIDQNYAARPSPKKSNIWDKISGGKGSGGSSKTGNSTSSSSSGSSNTPKNQFNNNINNNQSNPSTSNPGSNTPKSPSIDEEKAKLNLDKDNNSSKDIKGKKDNTVKPSPTPLGQHSSEGTPDDE